MRHANLHRALPPSGNIYAATQHSQSQSAFAPFKTVRIASYFVLNLGEGPGNYGAWTPSFHVKHFGANRAASLEQAREAV
jgi:hypothetical protein